MATRIRTRYPARHPCWSAIGNSGRRVTWQDHPAAWSISFETWLGERHGHNTVVWDIRRLHATSNILAMMTRTTTRTIEDVDLDRGLEVRFPFCPPTEDNEIIRTTVIPGQPRRESHADGERVYWAIDSQHVPPHFSRLREIHPRHQPHQLRTASASRFFAYGRSVPDAW